jgi:mannose-6-phosphate isomerase-like protein (cupin superfamily)
VLEPTRDPVTFKYEKPAMEKPKTIVWLARTDRLIADVQVLKEGGETNLHSHSHLDGFWYVLSGRAKFYGEGDAVLADLGPHEGVLLPRGTKYWFESSSPEPLELLQIEASDKPMNSQRELMSDRNDFSPAKRPGGTAHVEARAAS